MVTLEAQRKEINSLGSEKVISELEKFKAIL